MRREIIEKIVLDAIRATNLAREPENQVIESADAPLFGADGPLDSLGLVALLMEVEEGLQDAGATVSLAHERAMSQRHSPFRSVPALVDFVEGLLSAVST